LGAPNDCSTNCSNPQSTLPAPQQAQPVRDDDQGAALVADDAEGEGDADEEVADDKALDIYSILL